MLEADDIVADRRAHPVRALALAPHEVVQSVDDWKKAAPKPRRPAVARPDIAARKALQAEKNEAARRAEINRKKKEKKKAKKLEVREHFRQTL